MAGYQEPTVRRFQDPHARYGISVDGRDGVLNPFGRKTGVYGQAL
jgi:hypothetical protein